MPDAVPWIFLRGLMRDRRHWGDFPEIFKAQIPDTQIVKLDFPGNGLRNEERSLSRVEDMVEDCRRQLQARGFSRPYRMLAMSLGAMVAADWASRYPNEIEVCVLINTSLRPFSPPHWRLRPAIWPNIVRLALARLDARGIEQGILAMTSHQRRNDSKLLDDWTRWHEANPVLRSNALKQLRAAARYCASSTPPAARLLVLASEVDGLVDYRCSVRLAQRWKASIAIHSSAGHDLPLDDGPWVAKQAAAWLANKT